MLSELSWLSGREKCAIWESTLCDNNWLFDLAFLVNATNHLNHLNMKLQGAKNNMFSNLVNDEAWILFLAIRKWGHEPHIECAADIGNEKMHIDQLNARLIWKSFVIFLKKTLF